MKFCHCSGATAEMLIDCSDAAEMLRGETQLPCAFTTLTESPGSAALEAVACWNLHNTVHTLQLTIRLNGISALDKLVVEIRLSSLHPS